MDSRTDAAPACRGILVVDDERDIRESLQQLLELEGYAVSIAANGQEALDTLARLPSPQLIFLDLMMPVMDGWTFADEVRKSEKLAASPIVVISAFAEKAGDIASKAQLKKPLDIDQMLGWAEKLVVKA